MNAIHNRSTHDAYEMDIVDAPAVEGLRFLAVRLIRLVGTLVMEAGTFVGVVGVPCFGFFFISSIFAKMLGESWSAKVLAGSGAWYVKAVLTYPIVGFVLSVAILVYGWAMVVTLGSPNRYHWQMPGIIMVRCGSCDGITQDFFSCEKCHGFRADHIASWIVLQLNRGVTLLWAMHDGIFITLAAIA